MILGLIKKKFPSDYYLAEESATDTGLEHSHLWIVDPLDGTTNYSHHVPQTSISIAYAENGIVQLGVLHDVFRNETFTAVRGQGAFMNGIKIESSSQKTVENALIGLGFYYDRGVLMEKTLESIKQLFRHKIAGIRRFGSAGIDLSWVACGRFDGFFEYTLAPWDFAAALLIMEETGVKCTDAFGNPMTLKGKGIVAANSDLHREFFNIVSLK